MKIKLFLLLLLCTFFIHESFATSEIQFNSEEEREEFIAFSAASNTIRESDNIFIGEIISAKQFDEKRDWYAGIIEIKIKILKQTKGRFNDEAQFLYRYGDCANFSYWMNTNSEWSCYKITQKNNNIFLIASKIERSWVNLIGKNRLLSMSSISRWQIQDIDPYSEFYPKKNKNTIDILSGREWPSWKKTNYMAFFILLWVLIWIVIFKKIKR